MSIIKERPILFNGPMVRATLSGQKTVTRRAIKVQPHIDASGNFCVGSSNYGQDICGKPVTKHFINDCCPYGKPGDRLWVRETWGVISHTWDEHGNMVDWVPDRPATPIRELPFGRGYYSGHAIYAADGPNEWAGDDDGGGEPRSAWHPSIHMPKAVSRILLEVTDVRVERLQDITEEQALAEGVNKHSDGGYHVEGGKHYSDSPIESFAGLWSSVGGDWDANPWVWCVSFKRVTP